MRTVRLQNSGRVPALVQALVLDSGIPCDALVVEPAAFTLPARGSMDVHLTLTAARPGPLQLGVSFMVRQNRSDSVGAGITCSNRPVAFVLRQQASCFLRSGVCMHPPLYGQQPLIRDWTD